MHEDMAPRKRDIGRGDAFPLQAAKQLSEPTISEAGIEKQKQDLISRGYDIKARVAYAGNQERRGEIIGFNNRRSGFYSASRYPLIIKWDGESETFEYGPESLILE